MVPKKLRGTTLGGDHFLHDRLIGLEQMGSRVIFSSHFSIPCILIHLSPLFFSSSRLSSPQTTIFLSTYFILSFIPFFFLFM